MKVLKMFVATAALLAVGCGSEEGASSQGQGDLAVEMGNIQGQAAMAEASRHQMIIVRVKEDGKGDVLQGEENVEVRGLSSKEETLSSDEVSQLFSNGSVVEMSPNDDSLDGDSSQGQYRWRRAWRRGWYGGWHRGYGWGHVGYVNWYRPYYQNWNVGWGWGYGYGNYHSWGGFRYYCYW